MTMRSDPGTYAIVMRSFSSAEVQIGRWGGLNIEPGYYIYIGSAFGSGGVQARVSRHLRKRKKNHWHIDYLRKLVIPVCVWCSYAPINLEHRWAQLVAEMPGTSCIKGFGCTDCGCYTHLFVMTTKPGLTQFSDSVGSRSRDPHNYNIIELNLT